MTFISIIFLFPAAPDTTVAEMNYTVVVIGGTLILSIVWYYFPKVRRVMVLGNGELTAQSMAASIGSVGRFRRSRAPTTYRPARARRIWSTSTRKSA
jgi:hypothetical protein